MVGKKVFLYKIGDWIVHYYHGVGQVKDIVERGLAAQQDTFFRVATTEIEYWIPVDQADSDHIKPLRSVQEFEQALQIMAQSPTPMTETQNRNRRNIYERWLDGSLPARAALIRDLHGRDYRKELSYDDKNIYQKVLTYFIDEWIITNPGLSRSKASERLREALATSVRHDKVD